MAEMGHTIHSLGDQAAVTDWIYAASQGGGALGSVGGTPRRVFNALMDGGKMRAAPNSAGDKKPFSPCYVEVRGNNDKKLGALVQFAISKQYPVALAVDKPANHWIFAVSATAKTITCVDQQVLRTGCVGGGG